MQIKEDLRFKIGNACFNVKAADGYEDGEKCWLVRVSIPGTKIDRLAKTGLTRYKESKIIELYEESTAIRLEQELSCGSQSHGTKTRKSPGHPHSAVCPNGVNHKKARTPSLIEFRSRLLAKIKARAVIGQK